MSNKHRYRQSPVVFFKFWTIVLSTEVGYKNYPYISLFFLFIRLHEKTTLTEYIKNIFFLNTYLNKGYVQIE